MADIDEDELFNSAVSDEPTEVENSEPEQQETPVETTAEESPTVEPEKATVDDNAPLVPSWRLREINEEKRTLADKVATLEAERVQWQRNQPRAEPKPVEKAARPDPLLDPEGYAKAVRDELREEMLAERREDSLIRARDANQQEFDEAYKAAQQAVDPALKARMQSSRDPGKTLLEWHRENKVKAEVGTDPNAWLEKKLEERLKDPAFLAKAVELARGSAQPVVQNGRPRVELPPSLTNASRSNAALQADSNDMSDRELFNQVAG